MQNIGSGSIVSGSSLRMSVSLVRVFVGIVRMFVSIVRVFVGIVRVAVSFVRVFVSIVRVGVSLVRMFVSFVRVAASTYCRRKKESKSIVDWSFHYLVSV